MKFDLIIAVWGKTYTDMFLNITLPTMLTQGNLLAFRQSERAVYRIYTSEEDAETIKKSPIYSKLTEAIETEIKSFITTTQLQQHQYATLTQCQNDAIIHANQNDHTLVFLAPDAIFADGSFESMLKIAATGKRAIMIPGLQVCRTPFLKDFLQEYSKKLGEFSVPIPSRDLVKICLKNLHPESQAFFWESGLFSGHGPAHHYWRINNNSLLGRCFILHPLMVNPSRKDLAIQTCTLDMEYISLVCPDFNDVYVVSDSDEIFGCDLNDVKHRAEIEKINDSLKVSKSAGWASLWTTLHHQKYFVENKLRFHSEDISEEWVETEKKSDQVVAQIMAQIVSIYENDSRWNEAYFAWGRFGRGITVKPNVTEAFKILKKALENLYIHSHIDIKSEQKRAKLDLKDERTEDNLQSDSKTVVKRDSDFGMANYLKCEGKLSEAIVFYRKAIEKQPNFNWYHHNLGEVLAKNGQLDEAIACYLCAIELAPNFCSSYQLAEALAKQEKWDEAIIYYHKSIEINQNSYLAYSKLGKSLYQFSISSDQDYLYIYNRLTEFFGQFCSLPKNENELYDLKDEWFLSSTQNVQNDDSFMELVFHTYLKRDPDQEGKNHHINRLRNGISRQEIICDFRHSPEFTSKLIASIRELFLQTAITCYQRSIELYPNSDKVYQELAQTGNQLGKMLTEQGKIDQAVEIYRNVIAVNPLLAEGYYHLAKLLVESGQLKEAFENLDKAIKIYHQTSTIPKWIESLEVGDKTTQMLMKQGKLEEALTWVEKLMYLTNYYSSS